MIRLYHVVFKYYKCGFPDILDVIVAVYLIIYTTLIILIAIVITKVLNVCSEVHYLPFYRKGHHVQIKYF